MGSLGHIVALNSSSVSHSKEWGIYIQRMRSVVLVLVLVGFTHSAVLDLEKSSAAQNRDAKGFIKLFDLIEFSNSNCLSDSGSEIGTCFTEKECNANQGKSIGSCAQGFGVCCQFLRTCDQDTCYNNTYYTNAAYPSGNNIPGVCALHVKAANSNATDIKCLKLEFEDFDILGPTNGDCTNDTFTVSGGSLSQTIPVLCGVNTGNFIYVDTRGAAGPYKLTFNFGSVDYDRRWRIRVIQFSDEHKCPPRNCLQYYTEPMGTVWSFNYMSSSSTPNGATRSQLLNNLNYPVCFKSLDGYCDVSLTSDEFDWGSSLSNGLCENDYIGFMGFKTCGNTWRDIQMNRTSLLASQVVSDGFNSNQEAGFKIDYMQMSC